MCEACAVPAPILSVGISASVLVFPVSEPVDVNPSPVRLSTSLLSVGKLKVDVVGIFTKGVFEKRFESFAAVPGKPVLLLPVGAEDEN